MKKTLLLLLIVFAFGCTDKDEPKIEESKTNYYKFDFVTISNMIGTSYDATSALLLPHKVTEENLAGIRIGDYFLKDGVTILELELQESSANKVKKIKIEPSFLKYSDKEQLNMFVDYLKAAKSKFTLSGVSYDDGKIHTLNTVDDLVAYIQNNPTSYKYNTYFGRFKNSSGINVYLIYGSTKFGMTME